MGEKHPPENLGNFAEKNSYVVGIPLSPSTLYVDHPSDNNNRNVPPNELTMTGLRKRSSTSFQITSVTVQGHRLNSDECDIDSADDFDDSHTDDISSDILDSSRFTEPDGYQSEDNTANFNNINNNNNDDLSSPCGPLIITPLPSTTNGGASTTTINVGLVGIDMSPPFTAVGSGIVSPNGVTMVTSSLESPISAQVQLDNWQHRFKVVKIVSSEPFRRGRWMCMDFRDPPPPNQQLMTNVSGTNNNTSSSNIPSIQVTPSTQDITTSTRGEQQQQQHQQLNNAVAHVYDIPTINAAYAGNVIMNGQPNNNQPIYGIFLPHHQYTNENVAQWYQYGSPSVTVASDNRSVVPQQLNQGAAGGDGIAASVFSNSVPVSTSAFQQQPVLDGNANKVEPYPALVNGHEPNLQSSDNTTSSSVIMDNNNTNGSVPLNPVATTIPPDKIYQRSIPMECTESAASTGASTVAIDNKIEQAMDLVKSHLMFAVREEVEVLKEKITELLERISQLEHENDILRANASPETLKQLNQSQKKFSGHSVIGGKQQQIVNQHGQNQPPAS